MLHSVVSIRSYFIKTEYGLIKTYAPYFIFSCFPYFFIIFLFLHGNDKANLYVKIETT